VGEQHDAFWLGQIEELWADDHAADNQHYYLGNAPPRD